MFALFQNSFLRFLLVGGLNTLIGVSVIAILMLVEVPRPLAILVGYLFGLIFSFYLNKSFTFRNRSHNFDTIKYFGFVFLLCYFIAYDLATTIARQDGYLFFTINILVYTVTSFFGYRYFVFINNDN